MDPRERRAAGWARTPSTCGATGRLDLFVANFTHETNGYFRNEGDGSFAEATTDLGLAPSRLLSGFGAKFLDYDGDGRVDLFVLNGHPLDTIKELYPNVDYAEPPHLFENTGSGFREVAAERGEPLRRRYPGRGLAVGDYDNDGDPDLLLMSVGEKPVLLRNDGGNRRHWLGIALEGRARSRDAVGARVTVTAGTLRQSRSVLGGTSYCSVSDRRLLFGLGDARRVGPARGGVAGRRTHAARGPEGGPLPDRARVKRRRRQGGGAGCVFSRSALSRSACSRSCFSRASSRTIACSRSPSSLRFRR